MSKQHARYSPSMLDNLDRCIRFRYKQTDQVNEAAEEGTTLHKAFETGNLMGLDEEQAQMVTMARDYANSFLSTEGGPDQWLDFAEQRLALDDLTYGTADRLLIHKTKPIAHVMDAKFGRMGGDYNFQVRTYGAAAIEQALSLSGHELETITTHIIAPRLQDIAVETYDAQPLYTAVHGQIVQLYKRIDNPFTPPTPNEDLCGKCEWASNCPALGKVIKEVAPRLGLPLPAAFAPESLVAPKDRAIAQVLAGAFENWATQIKKHNTAYVVNGGEVPGFKLVNRSTGFRIPAEMTSLAIETLLSNNISKDVVYEGCSVTMGRLAKALAEARSITEAEAKETLKTMLAPIGTSGATSFLQKIKRLTDAAQLQLITNETTKL